MLSVQEQPNGSVSSKQWSRKYSLYIAIALTIAAPSLGGTVALWSQAVIALGSGLLFLFVPPRKSLGRFPNICFILLYLLAVIAFLPARWFVIPEWRRALSNIGVDLPGTLTAQPWLTLESSLLLLLALSWIYFLLASNWNLLMRQIAWVAIAGAITTLAAAVAISFALRKHIPFWGLAPEYGFFPNRNHTSNVLALGAVLIYALALRGFAEYQKSWWLWSIALCIVAWALLLTYSRAGIILAGGGILLWHGYWLITSERKRRPALASVGAAMLIGLSAWIGVKTTTRFSQESTDLFSIRGNRRVAIYRDALNLTGKSPFVGIGLGNFEAVFNANPQSAAAPSVAAHPESDLFLLATELGWMAPVLIGLLMCWWITRCPPLEPGTFHLMRAAALICGCGFALHSIFDVPAHQVGALWPAALISATALNPNRAFASSATTSWIFRAIGLIIIAAAAVWFFSFGNSHAIPTSRTLYRLTVTRHEARDRGDYAASANAASAALRIAPLNWTAYEGRGAVELESSDRVEAERDFAAARYLLPFWSDLWFKQGILWAAAGEIDRAFDLWEEMLRRFPNEAADLYRQIFDLISSDLDARERWRLLGRVNKQCQLVFFRTANPFEFAIELERLRLEDPQLQGFDRNEKAAFFGAWYEKGDKLELAKLLQPNPDWKKIGWRELAKIYADFEDYHSAYDTIAEFGTPPQLPQVNSDQPLEELGARFVVDQTNLHDGLALYFAQRKNGQDEAALGTLRQLMASSASPKYLRYVEAQLWAEKKEWQKAWQALTQYYQLR